LRAENVDPCEAVSHVSNHPPPPHTLSRRYTSSFRMPRPLYIFLPAWLIYTPTMRCQKGPQNDNLLPSLPSHCPHRNLASSLLRACLRRCFPSISIQPTLLPPPLLRFSPPLPSQPLLPQARATRKGSPANDGLRAPRKKNRSRVRARERASHKLGNYTA
jgi:hypothetical protein